MIQDIHNVLSLREVHLPISTVSSNLNTQDNSNWTQIMHFILLLELLFNSLQCGHIVAGNRQIIHISRNDDLNAIFSPHPDTVVRSTVREAKIREGVQLLVLPRTLLQPIKRLLETVLDLGLQSLQAEPYRSRLSRHSGRRDIHSVDLHVLSSSNG